MHEIILNTCYGSVVLNLYIVVIRLRSVNIDWKVGDGVCVYM